MRKYCGLRLQLFALIFLFAATGILGAEGDKAHTHGALTISLPGDWKPIDRETTFFVQGRYVAPDGGLTVSLGSILLPLMTFEEYVVCSTGVTRKGFKVGMKQIAEELGIPEPRLQEILSQMAGSAVFELLKKTQDGDLGISQVEKISVDSRSAYRIRSTLRVKDETIHCVMITAEGYSPGEIITMSFSGNTKDLEESVDKIRRSVKIADQRVPLNDFHGFALNLPAGTKPEGTPVINNERQHRMKFVYPLGESAKGLLVINQNQQPVSEAEDFKAFITAVHGNIEGRSKNPVFAPDRTWTVHGLQLGSIEVESDVEIDGKMERSGTRIVMVYVEKRLTSLTFYYPSGLKNQVLRSADSIMASIQERTGKDSRPR